MKHLEPGPHIVNFEFLEMPKVDGIFGDFRDGDIVGDIRLDGEILIPDPGSRMHQSLARVGFDYWYYLSIDTVEDEDNPVRYQMALGAPEGENVERLFHAPTKLDDQQLLILLFKTCFVDLEAELAAYPIGTAAEAGPLFQTPLHVILSVIPRLSPLWSYCSVFIPASQFSEQLKILAYSDGYPNDLLLNGVRLQKGQLLAGWVYQNKKKLVIQDATLNDDPRLRPDPHATAALAVPTWIYEKNSNGVFYVATTKKLGENEVPFPPFTQKYFYLLGSTLGEYIEREYIRSGSDWTTQQLLGEQPSHSQDWGSFSAELEKSLKWLKSSSSDRLSIVDNLHIVVIRLDDFNKIFERSPKIAGWLMEQAKQITDEYYIERKLGTPLSFPYDHMNWVFFLPRIAISDDMDRDFRYRLRDLLNSIPLQFSDLETVYPKFYVWSIPYRLSTLRNRVNEAGIKVLVMEIIQVVQRKLHTLKYIEDAHEHEKRRAYAPAYQAMKSAFSPAENDEYIMRHLAKYLFYQQDYKRALTWAKKVVKMNQQPSHYRRLAVIQMCLDDLDGAIESLEKGLKIDPADKRCRFMLGMADYAAGKFQEAIDNLREADRLDADEDITLLRFLAQAYVKLGDTKEAETILAGIESVLQDDPDLTWLRWQIQQDKASRPRTGGEKDDEL